MGMNAIRVIPEEFNQNRLAEIDRRIKAIADHNRVTIPLAIESGSRAWGFPSPDSDYDVRFLYVRALDSYVSPWVPRDVIETPLEDDMDVNGWDLGKAVKLMLKGNAVILEWLQSPIIYQADEDFKNAMLDLAQEVADRTGLARHYYHLGMRQWRTYFQQGEMVPIKKLFYVVRPALALRWLRVNSTKTVPPMDFQTLLIEAETLPDLSGLFHALVTKKAVTRELGAAPVPELVSKFILTEFKLAESLCEGKAALPDETIRQKTEVFFFNVVTKLQTRIKS
jgi:uncharacterized protein